MALQTSVLTGGVNNHQTTSEEANAVYTDFVNEGVVGAVGNTSGVAPATGSFAVNAQGTPSASIDISAGVAYVTGTPSSQNSQTFRIKNTATATLAISSNSSGSTKYDWIYIKLDATKLNAPNTAGDDAATIVASRSSSASADDGTPPTYGYPIAVVTVANGFTTITNSNIRDIREESGMTPTPVAISTESWASAGAVPTAIVCNGNRSYSLTWAASIIADKSVGMRNKYTRTVTAPTQCADLESGSSQYFSRASASVSGMTFTDDYTISAWIKLESYTGSTQVIISRNTTAGQNGWRFFINASGQLTIDGITSSGNVKQYLTYQSVPLGKWVHVAGSLDMSGAAAAIYIDGISVPISSNNSGTANSLTNSGDLRIGAQVGVTSFFDGKIAQVAVFSSVLSAATIRSYMSQGLAGNESTLVAAYSFDNSITDLTSNDNDLTANGSAAATATDSPFAGGDTLYNTDGTTDFSITTAISSDGLTETVQVPEGYTIPTSGGISAVSYSTQKVPYGFPADVGRWRIGSFLNNDSSTTSNTNYGAFISGGWRLSVPTGAWRVGWCAAAYHNVTTTVSFNISKTVLTGLSAADGANTSPYAQRVIGAPSSAFIYANFYSEYPENLTSSTEFVMYSQGATTAATITAGTRAEIFAECALL